MIKVKLKDTNEVRFLIGTGFGMYKAQGQRGWGSIPSTNEGEKRLLAVCDENGNIDWVNSDNCYVVEIDGEILKDL